MYDLHFYQCLLKSWNRCMEHGLSKEIEKPKVCLDSAELNNKLKIKNNAVKSFNGFIDRYLDLTKKIKGCYYFALFDNEENLLAIRIGLDNAEKFYNDKSFLVTGSSYSEKSVGTNAVSLSKLLKRPVYMLPDFHYCSKLKNWFEYCIPIKYAGQMNGYISVISRLCPISRALEGFLDLLGVNMSQGPSDSKDDDYSFSGLNERLTDKEYLILKMMAQGFTDIHISKELNLSLSTVKYHNQNIFRMLNASSRVDAVVKALMNNDLNIFDIYCSRQ